MDAEAGEARERDALRQALLALPAASPEALSERVGQAGAALARAGSLELSDEEFVAVLFLFNHRLSSVQAHSVFQMLLKVRMTDTQLVQLFDWKRAEEVSAAMYWAVNWSFLDKNTGTKQPLIPFLVKVAAKYPESVWDVLRMLFLLLDDENLVVRIRSYKGVYRVAQQRWRSWSQEEKQTFRSSFRYFGQGCVESLRRESQLLEKRQKEAKVDILAIGELVRVHVTLGQKIRGEETVVSVSGPGEKQLAGVRKHLFVYCKKHTPIVCTVWHKKTLLAQKELP